MALAKFAVWRFYTELVLFEIVVCCFIMSFSTTKTMTAALPMRDIIGRAMKMDHSPLKRQKRAVTNVTEVDCTQPSESELKKAFDEFNAQLNTTQFLQPPSNGKAFSAPASVFSTFIYSKVNRTCPSTLAHRASASLAERSLCPYYFDVYQLPEGYYPKQLLWARCKCQKCVQNNAYGCEAVRTEVTVLKPEGCLHGMQLFQEQIITVNTGCTCAFPSTSTASQVTVDTSTPWWVD